MSKKTIFIIICLLTAALLSGCGAGSRKRRIARTMHEYVQPTLTESESFRFIGLSNNRDTVFMGVNRPCAGVIYRITDTETGASERRYADVIFSNDYAHVLWMNDLDFDPIEYAEQKIITAFSELISQ